MRPAPLLALVATAACIASCTPSPPAQPHADTPTAHDSLLARAILEEEGVNARRVDPLYLQGPVLDSVARALAAFRQVDTALTRYLGDSSVDRRLLRIGFAVGLSRGADSVLQDSLLRCAAAPRSMPPGRPDDTTRSRPLPRGCWPELDATLQGLRIPSVRISQLFTQGVSWVEVEAPVPLNREVLFRLITTRTGHGVADPGGRLLFDLERSDSLWTFTYGRGYGDCPSGCIYYHYYDYLYSPRTGRAWKHGEHGDPWPPPKDKSW